MRPAVAILVGCMGAAAQGRAVCTGGRIAIPLALSGQVYEVPVAVGSSTLRFVVDTGAVRSVVDTAVARRLHLAPDLRHLSTILGVGGRAGAAPDVLAPEARLGGRVIGPLQLAVADLSGVPFVGHHREGVLGGDILGRFDSELDFPAGRLTLSDPGCQPEGPAWKNAATEVGRGDERGLIGASVEIDGHAVPAILDTGAALSTLPQNLAASAGLSAGMLDRDATISGRGATGPRIAGRLHRFGRLALGGDAWDRPLLVVVPKLPVPVMLLGLDYFHARRLWIGAGRSRVLMSGPAP